jgi:hypothetical protein
MISYKHTQVGYLMLVITFVVLIFFSWMYITASAEVPSVDSGPNFLISSIMTLILLILLSFSTLTVLIDENYLRVKFGYGLFRKKFPLKEILSAKSVKNHWYYGWGIKWCFWPHRMMIYNVSGFDAVEITMKNGRIYRIGTDVSQELEVAIKQSISS